MEAKISTRKAEWKRIKFSVDNKKEVYRANIFPTHPYVTFTDENWKIIEWTSYEFNTEELRWKTDELRNLTVDFIKEKWRSIIE